MGGEAGFSAHCVHWSAHCPPRRRL